MEFFDINDRPATFFLPYFSRTDVALCDKSVVTKQMWDVFHAQYAFSNDCLVIKNDSAFGGTFFDFPLAGENGDVEKALEDIEKYCLENYVKLKFGCLNEKEKETLSTRYPNFEVCSHRNFLDYVYDGENMRTFTGKKYAGQRNHINKFISLYPDARFVRLFDEDKPDVERMLDEWKNTELIKKDKEAEDEFALGRNFILRQDFSAFKVGGVRLGDKLLSFCFASEEGNTLVIHFEKALHAYEGVNVFMVREFAKAYPTKYVNREDDAGERGLRTSKMQYHPLRLEPECFFVVNNELTFLRSVPTLKTERLTLTPMRKEDAEPYFRLYTDEDRNKYWGYDYKKDFTGELKTDVFYRAAKHDFRERMGLNFAIRLNGTFIGETVLFEFDGKGECKLGVRILPEYDGRGYGAEAFKNTMFFALYSLGVRKLNSSCFKQNAPSVKMHEKLMRKTGEDGEKYYYSREY